MQIFSKIINVLNSELKCWWLRAVGAGLDQYMVLSFYPVGVNDT